MIDDRTRHDVRMREASRTEEGCHRRRLAVETPAPSCIRLTERQHAIIAGWALAQRHPWLLAADLRRIMWVGSLYSRWKRSRKEAAAKIFAQARSLMRRMGHDLEMTREHRGTEMHEPIWLIRHGDDTIEMEMFL